MAHRLVLLAVTLSVASIAGHSAVCSISPLGVLVTVQAATLLALPLAHRRLGFGWLAAYLVAGQAVLHVVMTVVSHGHGSLIPDSSMLAGHFVAALIVAAVTVRADLVVDFLHRSIFGLRLEPDAVVLVAHVAFSTDVSWRCSRLRELRPIRGPPLFS
jgi:hypothetical protein